jgi:hypothetical protein
VSDPSKVIKGHKDHKKLKLKELGALTNEIKVTLPTQEDIENSNTLYLYVENNNGSKQFIPVDCSNIKEFLFLTDKEEALEKFNNTDGA